MLKLSWCSLALVLVGCAASTDRSNPASASASAANVSGATEAPANQDHPQASADAASNKPVSVVIVAGVKENIPVLFHDADGNVLASVKTDATGAASAPDGITPAMATALLGYGDHPSGYTKAVTWTGVARGDVLTVRNLDAPTDNSSTVGFTVSGLGAYPGATGYQPAASPCQDPMGWADTSFLRYASCQGESTVLMEATAGVGTLLAYAYAKNLTPPTADGTPLTLTTWIPASQLTVMTPNLPADMESHSLSFFQSVGSDFFGSNFTFPWTDTEAVIPFAPGFADHTYVTLALAPNDGLETYRVITQLVPPDATSATLDAAKALPAITSHTLDNTDTRRPSLSWTSAAPLTDVDGGAVAFDWGGSVIGPGWPIRYVPADGSGSWVIYVAADATSVKVPVLPDEYKFWRPVTNEIEETRGRVRFDDIDDVNNAKAYRNVIAGSANILPVSTMVRTTGTEGFSLSP